MRSRAALAAVLALVCALTTLLPVPVASAADPVRILILGDSSTQGSSGDWTWRYWLWRALRGSGASVDFVGPHDDVHDVVAGRAGSQDYASTLQGLDPDFDRDHAARWGLAMASSDQSITSLMTTYRPDVVVEARGLIDLAWQGSDAEHLDQILTDEVAEARAVDPGVDFVVTRLPQQWYAGVDAYNATLPALAADLSVPGSTVVASDTGHGFEEGVDSWDPGHFSATGEVKMASGVADALATIGVGGGAGVPPTVSNGHWGGARLEATPGDRSALLSWTGPPGALVQYVWVRERGRGDWTRLPYALGGTSWTAGGMVEGVEYELRLQAAKGTIVSDTYSNVVSVMPLPATPQRPASLTAVAGLRRLTVAWRPVAGATSYRVTWAGATTRRRGERVVTGTGLAIGGLVAGERYAVTVVARNAAGPGPGAVVRGTARGVRVAGPARLRAHRVNATRVRLSWRARAGATSYAVSVRRHGRWVPVRATTKSSMLVRRAPRGVVAFRVQSRDQLVVGGSSVVASR